MKRAQGPSVIEIRPSGSNEPSTADRVSRPHEKAGTKVRQLRVVSLALYIWMSENRNRTPSSEMNSMNHYHYIGLWTRWPPKFFKLSDCVLHHNWMMFYVWNIVMRYENSYQFFCSCNLFGVSNAPIFYLDWRFSSFDKHILRINVLFPSVPTHSFTNDLKTYIPLSANGQGRTCWVLLDDNGAWNPLSHGTKFSLDGTVSLSKNL